MHPLSRLPAKIYSRLAGLDPDRLQEDVPGATPPALGEVLYFAYRRGFWSFVRGLLVGLRLKHRGRRFFVGRSVSLLFPSHLSVGRNVAIGAYSYLNCLSREGIRLGDNVRLREFAWVQATGHLNNQGVGLDVGAGTYIGPHSLLGAGGGIHVGRDVIMGAYVQLLAENHGFDGRDQIAKQGVTRKGISVGDGCWLGNSVIVLDGVTIGPGSVVGAGSVVTDDIPAGMVAAGNPARILRSRGHE